MTAGQLTHRPWFRRCRELRQILFGERLIPTRATGTRWDRNVRRPWRQPTEVRPDAKRRVRESSGSP
jgi:hypothetical protein